MGCVEVFHGGLVTAISRLRGGKVGRWVEREDGFPPSRE